MSLILDALKRAERERRLEKAPDLTAIYEEDHLSRRGVKSWAWLSGIFLIGAIVVAFILWPDRQPTRRSPMPADPSAARSTPSQARAGKEKKVSSAASSQSPFQKKAKDPSVQASVPRTPPPAVQGSPAATATPTKPAAAAPVETPPSRPGVPTAPPKTSPAGAGKPAAEPPPKGPPQPAVDVSAPRAAAGSPTEKTEDASTLTPAAPAPKASPPTSVPGPAKATPLNPPVPSAPPEAAPSPPPSAEPAKQASPGKKTSIPLLSELPYEVREKLGNLQINVHSYSEDPKERLIFINMKSYKVGDHIGENGPVLKEITPEGAVIDTGDGLVRLQVWR